MLKTLLLLLTLLTSSSTARALPEFPEELQKAADTPCLPHCNVCHRDDNAGYATVDRPFGVAMEHVGLRGSLHSLDRAVEALRNAGTDSDGDGTPDIEELSMGDDPNNSFDASICGPRVGCSARPTPAAADAGELLWALCALVLGRRRRTIS